MTHRTAHLFKRLSALERSGFAPRRSRKTRKTAHGRRSPTRTRDPVIRAIALGSPISITYRHVDGGTYLHKFPKGARLSYTRDGRHLVISGAAVKSFIDV